MVFRFFRVHYGSPRRVRWVDSHAPLVSSGSIGLGIVAFLLGSFKRAMRLVWFIRVRWVHSGAHLGSLGSFGYVSLIWASPGVHSGLLGSFRRSLRIVGFVRVRWVHFCAAWGFVVFNQVRTSGRWFHSVAPCGTSGSLVFVVVIRARPGIITVRWVHSGARRWSLCSFGIASSGLFKIVGFIQARPGGRRFQSSLLDSFGRALGIGRFIIRAHPWGCLPCGFVRIIRGGPGGRLGYSALLGSFWLTQGVDAFICRTRPGSRRGGRTRVNPTTPDEPNYHKGEHH